jgi:predicted transposase/invertase (TIGR01784 family)
MDSTISKSEREQAAYLSRIIYVLDQESNLYYATQKGVEIGREEGIKEGIKKGIIETARNCLKQGLTAKQTAAITGLSIEEVAKLQED